jgi:hypothetical protein
VEPPAGSPDDDPPTTLTVPGLGTRKNDLVLDLIEHEIVEVYTGREQVGSIAPMATGWRTMYGAIAGR